MIAVLFLEFWKRRQFQLQYEWDTLGYEAAEVSSITSCYALFHPLLLSGKRASRICAGHQEKDQGLL